MNNFINFLLESGISIACFAAVYLLVFRHENNFQFNRFYLVGSVFISLLIPSITIESRLIAAPEVLPTIYLDGPVVNGTVRTPASNMVDLFIVAYATIAGYFLFMVGRKIRNIGEIMGRCTRHEDYNIMRITRSDDAFSFLDTIYLGDNIPEERRKVILEHEIAHVRQMHSLDILFFEIVSCIFWINPIFRIIKSLAETNHEFLADATVVKNNDPSRYIQILSQVTLAKLNYSMGIHFYSANAIKRIKMIRQSRPNLVKFKHFSPAALVLGLVFIFSCEGFDQQLEEMTANKSDAETANLINNDLRQEMAANAGEGGDEIFDIVEEQPMPQGGMGAFYKYVGQNMKYPAQARSQGIQGRVFIQFIVDKSGKLTNVTTVKGIGGGCDKEAERVVANAAKWTPGLQKGKAVSVRMIMPITFKLADSDIEPSKTAIETVATELKEMAVVGLQK